MAACSNKAKSGGVETEIVEAADSTEAVVEVNDTTPMPMFLMGDDNECQQMVYWTGIEEPVKDEYNDEWFDEIHAAWALQETFRRNRTEYTNLIVGDRMVKMKYVDEVTEDPDGNTPSIGELHGRKEIPSLCSRFTAVNISDKKASGEGVVLVTDAYLQSRKWLTVTEHSYYGDKVKKLPADVVKLLEERYGMKASRSVLAATIGENYSWGVVQFKGEYKNAPKDKYNQDRKSVLALDVLTDGTAVYAVEEYGYYESESDFGWNVDDDGQFIPSVIAAAFEGPEGLELCYTQFAPESAEVGMFLLRDGKMEKQEYTTYHSLVDEQIPIWKKDLALMDSLYHADEMSEKDVELTKWAHCYFDWNNEWIWLRDKDDKYGAFFIRKDGKIRLMAIENPTLRPSCCEKDGISYLKLAGPAGGPSWQQEIHAFKDGKRIEVFNCLEIYGEIDECSLNGKPMTREDGQVYLRKVPEGKEITAYFTDIKQE